MKYVMVIIYLSINGERSFVLPGVYDTSWDCAWALSLIEPKEPAVDYRTGKKVINLVCARAE